MLIFFSNITGETNIVRFLNPITDNRLIRASKPFWVYLVVVLVSTTIRAFVTFQGKIPAGEFWQVFGEREISSRAYEPSLAGPVFDFLESEVEPGRLFHFWFGDLLSKYNSGFTSNKTLKSCWGSHRDYWWTLCRFYMILQGVRLLEFLHFRLFAGRYSCLRPRQSDLRVTGTGTPRCEWATASPLHFFGIIAKGGGYQEPSNRAEHVYDSGHFTCAFFV